MKIKRVQMDVWIMLIFIVNVVTSSFTPFVDFIIFLSCTVYCFSKLSELMRTMLNSGVSCPALSERT